MKYKKIFAIILIVVFLSCVFCIPSFAYSADLGSDGWVNIKTVDRIQEDRPQSSGSNFFIYTRDDVPLPNGWGYTATNDVTFSSQVSIFFSDDSSLSDIIVKSGYGFDLFYQFCYYLEGEAYPFNEFYGSVSFYDDNLNLYSFPLIFSTDPETGFRTNASLSFKNDTGKDLHLGHIVYSCLDPAVAGTFYWASYFVIKYKSLSPQDQITQGWSPNPETPTGSGTVDQQTQLEDQIMQDSEQGLNDATSALNAAGSILAVFRDGFIFLMGLFGLATDISLVNNLLSISLALGIFIFVLNLTANLMKNKGGD